MLVACQVQKTKKWQAGRGFWRSRLQDAQNSVQAGLVDASVRPVDRPLISYMLPGGRNRLAGRDAGGRPDASNPSLDFLD